MSRRISYKEAYDNRSVPIAIANKQDRLTAGNAIAISDDNVISVYGTEFGGYEAGEGISIDQNVISCTVSTDDLATKAELTAGLAGKQDVGDYATNTALNNGLAGKQDYSILIRKIHIGSAETPDDSLGEDGDLYIYRP